MTTSRIGRRRRHRRHKARTKERRELRLVCQTPTFWGRDESKKLATRIADAVLAKSLDAAVRAMNGKWRDEPGPEVWRECRATIDDVQMAKANGAALDAIIEDLAIAVATPLAADLRKRPPHAFYRLPEAGPFGGVCARGARDGVCLRVTIEHDAVRRKTYVVANWLGDATCPLPALHGARCRCQQVHRVNRPVPKVLAVFVGGPFDGEWREIEDDPVYRAAPMPNFEAVGFVPGTVEPPPLTIHTYLRHCEVAAPQRFHASMGFMDFRRRHLCVVMRHNSVSEIEADRYVERILRSDRVRAMADRPDAPSGSLGSPF